MQANIEKRGSDLKFQAVDSGIFMASSEKALTRSERSELLNQNGLREPTYEEALSLIQRKPEIIANLGGKWLDLAGNAPSIKGIYTFDEKGQFTKGSTNTERNVYVCKSIAPLSMLVCSEYNLNIFGFRFIIDESACADNEAKILLGVIDSSRSEASQIKRR